MVNSQKIKTMEYIKQLEKENKLLKEHLLNNILSENTEIIKLNLQISTLERTIENLKRKNAHLMLFSK